MKKIRLHASFFFKEIFHSFTILIWLISILLFTSREKLGKIEESRSTYGEWLALQMGNV
jgi:hypothetical protein